MGAEGTGLTPGEEYLQANTAGEWIEAILNTSATRYEQVAQQGLEKIQKLNSPEEILKVFRQLLIDLGFFP